MAFKVGDEVVVRGTVHEVSRDNYHPYPLHIRTPNDQIGFWTNRESVQPATPEASKTPSPDYCLGFADGYDFGYNGDDAHTTYRFYETGDFRDGWAAGYRHARAGIDAVLLAEVEGGK